MSRTDDCVELVDRYSARNYAPIPVVIHRGEGIYLYDVEGRRYMDMLSAYSAVNQGHQHPHIVDAMIKQMKTLALTSRAFHNDKMGPFLKQLCQLAGFDKALPMNTGAEAVETAIKLARRWAYYDKKVEDGKAEMIVCEGNFHGRTTTIVGFSTDEDARRGFGPITPGFKTVAYGDASALQAAITPNTAAFLVEPIQGEAGVKVPPHGYLKAAWDICKKNNVLFICDEIQTGLGRTGAMFRFQSEAVSPDVLILGKALSGGLYPVSAVLASAEIMSVFDPGSHGSTYGGNPLACAVASAALDVLVNEQLADRAREMGQRFLTALKTMESDERVKDIRGAGLLIAIEFHTSIAKDKVKALAKAGILAKDTHQTTIRFAPPLIISKEQVDEAMEIILKTLRAPLTASEQ
jgi:ornithine--oxo-acid transaminase